MSFNRKGNCQNPHQGDTKKVLCVCSAGLLRSPTAAVVLSAPPFNFNTRAVGISNEYALIAIDDVHLHWADEIVCMNKEHADALKGRTEKPLVCLFIPDTFAYRDPRLVELISKRYSAWKPEKEKEVQNG